MTLLFRPMLAYSKTPALSEITYPCLASPKLDGIRSVMADGIPFTRSMKRVPNLYIQKELAKLELHGLDGELMLRCGDFNSVQSAVMSVQGEPDFYLAVFDKFDCASGFAGRLAAAARDVLNSGSDLLRLVEHTLCNNEQELQAIWDRHIAMGYEGTMVRAPNGPYKRGRSTLNQGYLLKLKKWEDAEATVIGFEEGESNANESYTGELGQTKRSSEQSGMVPSGTLGALRVRWNGQEFKVGTGFGGGVPGKDKELRDKVWASKEVYLGSQVTFKYQELSRYGVPRFPVFKGFRANE